MRFPTYSSALSWLYARNQFAMKMGLEKTRELLGAVGGPHGGGVYLHVAGTNGKGSVCLALAKMLPALGVKRVGLYTSPHLVSFRERIRVDGEPVPTHFVTGWLNEHIETLERLNPTYFEIVTAMAFAWFRACGCEAVVLETGLGGRLDATNVITPRVTVITSIALDHVAMLGDTVEAVQREKLGIVKAGAPLIVDEARPALVRQATAAAQAVGVSILNLADRFDAPSETFSSTAALWTLHGRFRDYALPSDLRAEGYQMRNAALAVLALEAWAGAALPAEHSWVPALRDARMPGRMQRVHPVAPSRHIPVLLDGAHNPAAAEALADALRREPRGERLRLFFSMMSDKDHEEMSALFRSLSDDLVFIDLSAVNPRALRPEALSAQNPALIPVRKLPQGEAGEESGSPPTIRVIAPARDALEPLLRLDSGADRAVFCGSLYLLGEIIPLLVPDYEGLEEFGKMKEEDEGR
jgi:dihydrofolate synthase/folylpolyglutamate synthase